MKKSKKKISHQKAKKPQVDRRVRRRELVLERLDEQKRCSRMELESIQREISRARTDLDDITRQLSTKLLEFSPEDKRIKLPSGNVLLASTFKLDPYSKNVFLLNQVDAIIFDFRSKNGRDPVIVLNPNLFIRLFGTIQRVAEYSTVQFVTSPAVEDNKLVTLSKYFIP